MTPHAMQVLFGVPSTDNHALQTLLHSWLHVQSHLNKVVECAIARLTRVKCAL